MNFKKLVCLTIAFAMAFAPVVSAQEAIIATCKCPVSELIYSNKQGMCQAIDYEGWRTAAGDINRNGYNERSQSNTCRVVFQICNCKDQRYFKVNEILGIRMTILTPGVFWTDERIGIQAFQNLADVCSNSPVNATAPNGKLPNVLYYVPGDANYDTDNPKVNAEQNLGKVFLPKVYPTEGPQGPLAFCVPSPGYGRAMLNPGAGLTPYINYPEDTTLYVGGVVPYPIGVDLDTKAKYMKNAATPHSEWDDHGGSRTTVNVDYEYFMSDGVTPATAIDNASAVKCAKIPVVNQAQVVQLKGAYQIGTIDDFFNLSRWWIDIPEMRWDYDLVQPFSELKVKIEILSDTGVGVCQDCISVCEDVVTLGVFGADSYAMYFPYVLINNPGWFTGIAVTNLDLGFSSIADMEATFTLVDSTGKKFTYEKTDFNKAVWATSLDAILPEFTGGTPQSGYGYLKVETNFPVDGYEFLTDGNFGAGTLPRIYMLDRMRTDDDTYTK